MSEFHKDGVEDGGNTGSMRLELNGRAFELLSHILPHWLHQSFVMQQNADNDEQLKKLELVLFQKTNFSYNEFPRLRVRLEPHGQSLPIEYLDMGQLVDITIVVPLTFIRDLDELDGLELAMLHVKMSTQKGVRIRKLALAPTSLKKYTNFDNLVIDTVKDGSGVVWVDSITELDDPDSYDPNSDQQSDFQHADTALSGFRRLYDKHKNKSIAHQLEEVTLLQELLESDEYLKIGPQ